MLRRLFLNKIFVLSFGLITFLFIFLNSKYFFPSDILNYIPSFSEKKWDRPHNSLLADPVFQFEPWRHFAKEKIIKGEFPLWNDLNGGGSPFFANPQTAVLYPLNFIYYFLPLSVSLNLIPILKTLLFFIFTYLYIRSIGVGKFSAAASGMIVSTSGFFMVWLLWPHTNVFLLFPFLLLITERLKQKNNNVDYILIAIGYCIAVFGGHPETLFLVTLVHLLYSAVRFGKDRKKTLKTFSFVILGYLLGAVQLIPFMEYLLNSHAFNFRMVSSIHNTLPILSIPSFIFPFFFGAPHTEFYKSIIPYSNFQEYIGGYVGLIALISVISNIKNLNKSIAKLWIWVIIVSALIAFGIFPFNLINNLPIFSLNANHRLISFTGFGLAVLFSITLDQLLKGRANLFVKKIPSYLLVFAGVLLEVIFLATYILIPSLLKPLLKYYAFYLTITMLTTLYFLYLLKKKVSLLKTIIVLVFLQTGFLFINYIPLTEKSSYYPKSDLIKKLQDLPQGRILEVGNPSIYKNINLMYGLESAQNDDALEIKSYKEKFNNEFSVKNRWGNPDNATIDSVNKLGIRYVISDYDINSKRQVIQGESKDLLKPLGKGQSISVDFIAQEENLSSVRIITANYNRLNNCLVIVSIKYEDKILNENRINCKDVRDGMYYTIPLESILEKGKKYRVAFRSGEFDDSNAISFWGLGNYPYMEVLHGGQTENFRLAGKTKTSYIFALKNFQEILIDGSYEIIHKSSTEKIYLLNSNKDQNITINQTYYPGWEATINEKQMFASGSNALTNISISKGRHVLSLAYRPFSFLTGVLVSLISLISILIISVRIFMRNNKVKSFISEFNIKVTHTTISKNIQAFIIFSLISTLLLLFLYYLIPAKFNMPFTTAINWLTVHSYPKQKDIFYYLVSFSFITLITFVQWFLWIWVKK